MNFQMKNQVSSIRYMGDPLLAPITTHENTFLVRFLHRISTALNQKFDTKIQLLWSRDDFIGKLSKQILYPPMEIQYFDKSNGISNLKREWISPRISLRSLGSNVTIFMIIMSILFGHLIWRSSAYGLFLMSIIFSIFVVLKAIFS